jgi:hypothetical protein
VKIPAAGVACKAEAAVGEEDIHGQRVDHGHLISKVWCDICRKMDVIMVIC